MSRSNKRDHQGHWFTFIGVASFSVAMILAAMNACTESSKDPGTPDRATLSQQSGEKADRSTDSSREPLPEVGSQNEQALLKGSRVVIGTVTAIKGNQIEVEYEDSLQPRFLPLKHAKEKGMEIAEGDRITMVFNEQHVLVDYHPIGHVEGDHKIIRGALAQQMPVGQEHVVIKTQKGETVTFSVRPLARSRIASLPVGADAVFLADETGKIVDANYGSEEALDQVSNTYEHMSNPKSAHTRIDGVLFDALKNNAITIETSDGTKVTHQVRPFLKDELSAFKQGERLTLLLDSDNYVIDVANLQGQKK